MKKILLVLLLICALCVCAAAETEKITMEYMIQRCGLTEADFEGIDFDDFAACFDLTPEVLEEFDGASMLSLYKMQLEMLDGTDYTEIFRESSGKLQEGDIAHISAVIWELHQGMDNEWMAVDFEKKAVYGGRGFGLDCCQDKDQLTELTEDDEAFVREKADEAGITGWDNIYTGKDEMSYDGNLDWAIGIRLDSGKCVRYEGSGREGVSVLEQMTAFCQSTWDRYAMTVQ